MGSRERIRTGNTWPSAPTGVVTTLLRDLAAGREGTLPRLLEAIYPDLRRLAEHHFRREREASILQPTALVHEAYLRLVAHEEHNWQNRAHFFGAAAHIMRRILVDYARAQKAQKRGDGSETIPIDDVDVAASDRGLDLIALDAALDALERLSPRQARIVQLRYFGGLTVREVAEALGVTTRTVDREWAIARAWLRVRLGA
jgi:RNA polymerase sigma factor (TIGR02999 family)